MYSIQDKLFEVGRQKADLKFENTNLLKSSLIYLYLMDNDSTNFVNDFQIYWSAFDYQQSSHIQQKMAQNKKSVEELLIDLNQTLKDGFTKMSTQMDKGFTKMSAQMDKGFTKLQETIKTNKQTHSQPQFRPFQAILPFNVKIQPQSQMQEQSHLKLQLSKKLPHSQEQEFLQPSKREKEQMYSLSQIQRRAIQNAWSHHFFSQSQIEISKRSIKIEGEVSLQLHPMMNSSQIVPDHFPIIMSPGSQESRVKDSNEEREPEPKTKKLSKKPKRK